MFVVVIMDNFDYLICDWLIFGFYYLDEYVRVWFEYDLDVYGCVKYVDIVIVLKWIVFFLGFGKFCFYREVCKVDIILNSEFSVFFLIVVNLKFEVNYSGLKVKILFWY